ncbi:toll/interleukin-1 receptor domain-containing protein [Priestia megaterium]|uniref:toll/interleukin-1 receptor domain-containing protein n=1 Tax=Priestia megaterium TaxID=1404 RepID=UPI002877612F|nr:toll/interleukin-1 receptor domain-containing protein [Priestia megaterium]MBX4163363.1 toll/interleukin-1 receptor domain-containing protein [Priestia megaterium]
MSKKIFISHAVKDKELVETFVDDLLNSGMDISSRDIFCSSLSGMGIPSGKNFVEYIKEQIQSPEVVIVFFSKAYINSQFCMSELGATWVLAHNMLPVIIPPLTHDDIKGVLTGIQVDRINDGTELTRFMEGLKDIFQIDISFSKWERKRTQFSEKLPQLLEKISYEDNVHFKEYQLLEKKYNDAQQEIIDFEKSIGEKEELIQKLKNCKDKEEVEQIVDSESKPAEEHFSHLISKVNDSLGRLPDIVSYVLYKELYARINIQFDLVEEKYLYELALSAYENKYLEYDEPNFYINSEDFNVKNAVANLEKLDNYLNIDIPEELLEKLAKQDGFYPSLQNKRFWKTYFPKTTNYL